MRDLSLVTRSELSYIYLLSYSISANSQVSPLFHSLSTHSASSASMGSLLISRGRCSEMLPEECIRKAVLYV